MARIHLVRHGATIAAEGVYSGSQDNPLSERGKEMAKRLSSRLESHQIDAFYCSQKKRAMETSFILAKPHMDAKGNAGDYLCPTQIGALNEIDHGRWEGKTKDEILKEWPDEYERWEEDPYLFAPDGGENGLSVVSRAVPAMDDIIRTNMGKTVVVVSHKAVIRLIIAHYLGIPHRNFRDCFDLDPASLTTLLFKKPTVAKLMLYNDTSHYSTSFKTFSIIVNGIKRSTAKAILTYEDVIEMAIDDPNERGWLYSMIYDKAIGDKRAGILSRGQSVAVSDGMVFTAMMTNNA